MNLPNKLTLTRIFLGIIVPFMLFSESLSLRLWAFVVFVIAGITDLLDGKISRKYNLVTTFGKIMDPIADKVLNLGTFFVFYLMDRLPLWVLITIFIREFFVTAFRLKILIKGKAIAAEWAGKLKATFQYFTLGFIYLHMMNQIYLEGVSPEFVGTLLFSTSWILIFITLFMTLYSGYLFFRKNWKLR